MNLSPRDIAARRATKIVVDTSLLICFGVAFYTATSEGSLDPDRVLHSWVGLALLPLLAVHLASNARWITRVWLNKHRDREARLAGLNTLLAVEPCDPLCETSDQLFDPSHGYKLRSCVFTYKGAVGSPSRCASTNSKPTAWEPGFIRARIDPCANG